MPEPSSSSTLETYVLLANGARGAAAVGLVQQVLESPGIYVFGELLDHANIKQLESDTTAPQALGFFRLLNIFAYGTYADYLQSKDAENLPPLTDAMRKKLRLLTVATFATEEKTIKYDKLMSALGIDNLRELEDLIIEGANNNVLRGKLDQKSSHFEVDFAMGRDIRKSDIGEISKTLNQWCENCDGMLSCIEAQVVRANTMKEKYVEHKNQVEKQVSEIREQLKAKKQLDDAPDDPDSRMDTDRRYKKGAKSKGIRDSVKASFWLK